MVDFTSGGRSETQQALHAKYMCEHLISLGDSSKQRSSLEYSAPYDHSSPRDQHLVLGPKFYLGEEQVAQLVTLSEQLTAARAVPVQKLARLAGLIISRQHYLGPAARLRTRAMY